MKLLKRLGASLRGGTPGMSPLESQLLQAVAAQLDPERARKLRLRLDAINLVQRHEAGRQVNTYAMKSGKPTFDDALRLVATDDECKLAQVAFSAPDGSRIHGDIWLVAGQVFSLEFDAPTAPLRDHSPSDLVVTIRI